MELEFNMDYIHNLVKTNNVATSDLLNLLKHKDLNLLEMTDVFFKLLVKQPLKFNTVRVKKDTLFAKHVIENKKRSCTMYNLLLYKGNPGGIEDYIIKLYNSNYKDTIKIVNYINKLVGDDKVPYLNLFINNLIIMLNLKDDIFKNIEFIFSSFNIFLGYLNIVKSKYGYIKFIGGETFAYENYYDDIDKYITVDYNFINKADIGYDLGGGFMTPTVSNLFKREMVCVDKTSPMKGLELKNLNNFSKEYIESLKNQKWLEKDLIFDKLDNDYHSYFISSFGFINSTIGPRDYLKKSIPNVTNYLITYSAVYRLCELIQNGKELYCIFWGRPTSRVNENKLLSLKFSNKRLIEHEVLSDPHSTKYCETAIFGSRRVVQFI